MSSGVNDIYQHLGKMHEYQMYALDGAVCIP
jgi:hypothetical protein